VKKLIIAVFIAVLLVTVAAVPALATKPIPCSYSWEMVDSEYTDVRYADGNIFYTYIAYYEYEGDLIGTAVNHGRMLVQYDDLGEPGHWAGHETGTFTGSYQGGAEGTAVFNMTCKGVFPDSTGTITMHGQSGSLANLHGAFKYVDVGYVGGTATGFIHFDP